MAPEAETKLPKGAFVHIDCPEALLKVPKGQLMQAPDCVGAKYPAEQMVHESSAFALCGNKFG
jgi:hypothetical protein